MKTGENEGRKETEKKKKVIKGTRTDRFILRFLEVQSQLETVHTVE
jgi:uncharacterized protein Veg